MGKQGRERRTRIGRIMGLYGCTEMEAIVILRRAKSERRKFYQHEKGAEYFFNEKGSLLKRIAKTVFRGAGIPAYQRRACEIRKFLKPWKKDFNPLKA
jgi:hypothetical protein